MNYAPFTVQILARPRKTFVRQPAWAITRITSSNHVHRRQRLFWMLEDQFMANQAPHLTTDKERKTFCGSVPGPLGSLRQGFCPRRFQRRQRPLISRGNPPRGGKHTVQITLAGRPCWARRLVESRRFRCRKSAWAAWDTHGNNFAALRGPNMLPTLGSRHGYSDPRN